MDRVFKEILGSGKFVITAEIEPPKGINLERVKSCLSLLKDTVDAFTVSDNNQSIMRMSPWAVCQLIQEQGGEAILTIACRDRNRLALQSDLLAAASLGIHNLLCLTGNHVLVGDHPEAKPVFDLDSVQLLQMAKLLQEGRDLAGNTLDGAPNFYLGAVVNPMASPLEPYLLKFGKKVEAGAKFFQTHPIFDIERFKQFIEKIKPFKVKILAGIKVFQWEEIIQYEEGKSTGLFIPKELLEEIKTAGKERALEKGIEVAANIIKQLKTEAICDGVHIMIRGKEELIPEVLKKAGI